MAFDPSKYAVAKARPLPVILMLDRSGSMAGEKIATLNAAVNEMIESFKTAGQGEVEINLAIISFGGEGATCVRQLQPAKELESLCLNAEGWTPMGAALRMAKDMIEDKETIPSKGYRPAVVLVSDGAPNDDWEGPMREFVSNGRSSKCERFAMAIGTTEEDPVLNQFLSGTGNKVFLADQAAKIRDFFKFVTMSVSVRSQSQNPNALKALSVDALKALPAAETNPIDDLAREFGLLK